MVSISLYSILIMWFLKQNTVSHQYIPYNFVLLMFDVTLFTHIYTNIVIFNQTPLHTKCLIFINKQKQTKYIQWNIWRRSEERWWQTFLKSFTVLYWITLSFFLIYHSQVIDSDRTQIWSCTFYAKYNLTCTVSWYMPKTKTLTMYTPSIWSNIPNLKSVHDEIQMDKQGDSKKSLLSGGVIYIILFIHQRQ